MTTMTNEEFEMKAQAALDSIQELYSAFISGRAANELKTAAMYLRQANATERSERMRNA